MSGDNEFFFQVMLMGSWVNFPPNANKTICDAFQNGEKEVDFKLKIDGKEVNYTIDFLRMKQTSKYSKKERSCRPPWDLSKKLQGDAAETKEEGKFAGDDVEQEYKQAKEDKAAKLARENRIKALALLQKLLGDTANLKGVPEERLIEIRAEVAAGTRECLALELSEEEVRPLRDRVRKVHNTIQDLKGAIRVFARTRPFNQREKDMGSKNCLKFSEDHMTVQVENSDGDAQRFMFDTTFFPGTQSEVFKELKELVQSVFDGYNVTVFAYGQTGSGKTFTMYGPDNNRGVVMKTIDEVFRLKDEYSQAFDTKISFHMVELHNGNFGDLMYTKKEKAPKITVKKTPENEVLFDNATDVPADSPKQLWDQIQNGFESRKVAATAMNSESSRSHLFTVMKLEITNRSTGKVIKGKVTLVDLAGSERVKDSMVEGDALKEAIEINKSLTALGDVMSDISKGAKNSTSMRSTPLTNALSDSLGGTAKTLMFACLSPAEVNVSETIMTCQWAMRARKVVNDGQKCDKAGKAKAKPKRN